MPADVEALADRSGDQGQARADEPYRRALSGIYGRLAATYLAFTGEEAPRPPTVDGSPYQGPDEFRAELEVVAEGLGEIGDGGPLGRLIRAVETFGFHLATLDLRQNADVHERVVAELLKVAGVEPDYLALSETGRVALLRAELAGTRLLASPFAAKALPPLNPNQPTHSSPAPMTEMTTLCGGMGTFPNPRRPPSTNAATSAETPELTCTTVPPAKSSAGTFMLSPINALNNPPLPQTMWASGQ